MATRSRNATEAVLALARQRPELGVVRAARELRKHGVRLSPSGVREIWGRHNLGTSYQRLLSRRREGNGEDAALSESQRALLQRMRVSRRLIQQAGAEAAASGRREQLISAAARVIGAKGYERASLQEICAAAGILPGSLYYHFKSKEDLFIKVHAEGFRQLNEAVDRAVAAESDPWRRLEAACAAHLELLVASDDVSLVAGTSLFHLAEPALQRRLNRDRSAYEERFRAMIAALPLPREVDQTLLRLTLFGALNWTRVWYQPGRKTPAEIARHLVHTVMRQSLDLSPSRIASLAAA
ncbi:MAG TPA: TetR/AcrR family transcriptional regulator [Burkholderiales bacterium]|nr:TetR/AcrR family transcriptional regulator [Burkholderiales bacterium]